MAYHKITTDLQDAVVDPDVQITLNNEKFAQGWQTVVTAIAAAGNSQTLNIAVYGGHTVDGVTEYTLLHSDALTTATFTKPDGTTQAGYASVLVQDPWGKYDDLVLRVFATGTWTIRSSLRTLGTQF